MIHCAYWDRKRRALIEHELVDADPNGVVWTSMSLAALWKSGKHSLPTAIWVTWLPTDIEAEDFRLFDLAGDFYPRDGELQLIAQAAARIGRTGKCLS